MLAEMTMTAAQGWVLIIVTFFTGMTGLVTLFISKHTKDEGAKTHAAVNGHLAALEAKAVADKKDREREVEKLLAEVKAAAFLAGKEAARLTAAALKAEVADATRETSKTTTTAVVAGVEAGRIVEIDPTKGVAPEA